MFGVVTKPLEAHAIATEAAICYIIATVAISMAISVVVNHPMWGDTAIDIYNNYVSPSTRQEIDDAVRAFKFIPVGYMFVYDWTKAGWEDLTTSIIKYFSNHVTELDSSGITCTAGSSGKLGFTKDTLFSFELTTDLSKNVLQNVDLGDSTLSFGVLTSDLAFAQYPEIYSYSGTDRYVRVNTLTVKKSKFKVVTLEEIGSSITDTDLYRHGTYSSERYNGSNSLGTGLRFKHGDGAYRSDYIRLFTSGGSIRTAYYYKDYCYFLTYTSSPQCAFINVYNDTYYKSAVYTSPQSAIKDICTEAGLAVDFGNVGTNKDTVGVYTPGATDSDVPYSYDPTATDNALNDINSKVGTDADSVSTVIPTSDAGIETLTENPALITDPIAAVATVDVYPSDLPKINTDMPELWTTKFPFCLPFDIYYIIRDFYTEAECPKIHLLLMPKNSFGLNNKDIYFDFDLQPYEKIVKLLRFFESLAFVFFLISITKRLIK